MCVVSKRVKLAYTLSAFCWSELKEPLPDTQLSLQLRTHRDCHCIQEGRGGEEGRGGGGRGGEGRGGEGRGGEGRGGDRDTFSTVSDDSNTAI